MVQQADYGRPYQPERPYIENGYKPIGPPKESFCLQCKNYYKNLKTEGITDKDFPPVCYGDINEAVKKAVATEPDEEQAALASIYGDPISFAAAEFKWKPRWYQVEMLRCTSRKKTIRAGRRLGKSECAAVMILWLLYTNSHYSILLICPFQSQVKRIFDIMRKLIGESLTFHQSITRDVNNPHIIELANGSSIKGFSSGAKSGGKSNQIRGQDANCIVLDEADYLSEDDLESILAILASHPDCLLWASSTPTGARKFFFNWAINKNLGFKEFHYISAESPSWSEETETFFRDAYSEGAFAREFLAEFGDETSGVFKGSDINNSVMDYDYSDCEYDPKCSYVIGVDWNGEAVGTHIVVVESQVSDGAVRYRVVDKSIIEKSEFTQIKAVEEIIRLNYKWSSAFIYVDYGYGATQVEMLKRYGKDNPMSRIDKKVVGIQMGGNVAIKDPITGQDVNKPAKAFMVNVAARQVEAGRCIFPALEDTNAMMSDEGGGGHIGLVQQMRNFKVLKMAKNGSPTFTGENEHTLTAWMLAILGFFMEMSDINKILRSSNVAITGPMGAKGPDADPENIIAKNSEARARLVPRQRTMSTKPMVIQNNAGAVLRREQMLKNFKQNKQDPFKGFGGPGRRTTF
jgi:Terminase large subunit, T4likevirus-type, N-terminal